MKISEWKLPRLPVAALTLSILFFTSSIVRCQDEPPVPTVISSLASHPRLLFHDSELPEIKARIEADRFAHEEFENQKALADQLLLQPPSVYEHRYEPTLLWTAREIERRILILAGVYRLTGDLRFADRAIQEMLAASHFPDWNPSHFLDTAELTAALGIGYDWLYPVMAASTRDTIRNAMIRLGIEPFLSLLHADQIHYHNNWIQVLYGGEATGALAIAEKDDVASVQRAEAIIGYARPAIATIMKLFAPDGGFEEGPAYWSYATSYNVLYIEALTTSLGTDFGASSVPGFSQTPQHRIQSLGPTLLFANFGDAHQDTAPAPQMYWFSKRYNNPVYSLSEVPVTVRMRHVSLSEGLRSTVRFQMLGLLWYASTPEKVTPTGAVGTIKSFLRIGYVYMRTRWDDENAWFVALRGGTADLSHSHLDLGTFVLDALGERWALDLGPDSYDLPEYFGRLRWTYYRLQTKSHNTLTVDGKSVDIKSAAKVLRYGKTDTGSFALLELNNCYPSTFSSWQRGMKLQNDGSLLVQDEYIAKQQAEVTWHFHTRATISIAPDGRSSTLKQNGKTLIAFIAAPVDARFTTQPSLGGPHQADNTGVTDLQIRNYHASGTSRIAVIFKSSEAQTLSSLTPLSNWK